MWMAVILDFLTKGLHGHFDQNFKSVQKTFFYLVYRENKSFSYKLSKRKSFGHSQNFDQNGHATPLSKIRLKKR